MEILQVLSTLAIIVLLVLMIGKKFYTASSMLLIAIVSLIIYSLVTGSSVLGDSTCGNNIIDVFEFARTKFVSTFTSNGIIMLPVFGYSIYMNKIGASELFALLGAQPVKKFKSPYYVGIPIGLILAALVRLAIPSHTGVCTLLLTTLFPVLVSAGMSKITAASVILIGSSFDWGPADSVTSILLTNSDGVGSAMSLSDYAFTYQFKVFPIAIIVTIILLCITSKAFDAKDGFVPEEMQTKHPKDLGLPMYYAILPILPLIFMILFSKFVISSITISAFGASFLSFVIVIILESINKRNVKDAIEESKTQFEGMGKCYIDIVSTISCASVFAGAINALGGFNVISSWIQKASISPILVLIIVVILCILMTAITTSSTAVLQALVPFAYSVSRATGQNIPWYLTPLMYATGAGRSVSPISPAPLVCAAQAGCDPIKLTKRCYIPLIGGQAVMILLSLLMY